MVVRLAGIRIWGFSVNLLSIAGNTCHMWVNRVKKRSMEDMSDEPIINIAAYRFVDLDELPDLRTELRDLCSQLSLQGTVLIATEGINLFLAGTRNSVDQFIAYLLNDPRFSGIAIKESTSKYQPFNRMLVKIKRKIIPFGVPGVGPTKNISCKISPQELKRWLDEGRDFTLLDVRNDFEVQVGTFRGAVPIGIDHFHDFPAAVQRLPGNLKQQPVVMFCTGGIRCEKAGPYMEQLGYPQVFQLEGGILQYLESCGGMHYEGDCFVFDQRVALQSQLQESKATQCFNCQMPLSVEDQQSPFYQVGQSCPHCNEMVEEQQRKQIALRHAALWKATHPLPGSIPYENRLPVFVPRQCAKMKLVDCLVHLHPHVGREEWLSVFEAGLLQQNQKPAAAEQLVVPGERYERVLPHTVERDVNVKVTVLFEDEALIVINKPAPLPMHPSGRFNRNTLRYFMRQAFSPLRPRHAHRLDANTTGVVMFSKTRRVASRLQPQFQRGEVCKEYVARVIGMPLTDHFDCRASIGTRPQAAGARSVDPAGVAAHTEFELIRRVGSEGSLVRVRPRTGRTNQIRIHLWHLGLPVEGDPLYLPGGVLGGHQTLEVTSAPMCLHAFRITLQHPFTGDEMTFEAPLPEWASDS